MISVTAAKDIIRNNTPRCGAAQYSVPEAVGLMLAEDVYSTVDLPPFNQSNVDGYALRFDDLPGPLLVEGSIPAGPGQRMVLPPKQAVRIFTGSPVPDDADTVVMQEKVAMADGMLTIEDETLRRGGHYRPQGKDIRRGAVALERGTYMTAGAVGYLSALGVTHVQAFTKPAIAIIVTGNELQQPGQPLGHGQVYEANSVLLRAALQQQHYHAVTVFHSEDDLTRLTKVLKEALAAYDVVLLCGGISVGDYDYVLPATVQCGIETLFHTVRQRPGKPLFCGRKDNKIVFGLPGNPSSVLTCYYEYVVEALGLMSHTGERLTVRKAILANDHAKPAGLTFFLKGWYDGEKVIVLDAQESYRLSSYARANCLVVMDESDTHYSAGDKVQIHLLPGQSDQL
jgi:molybdopterin molybdotransferase